MKLNKTLIKELAQIECKRFLFVAEDCEGRMLRHYSDGLCGEQNPIDVIGLCEAALLQAKSALVAEANNE